MPKSDEYHDVWHPVAESGQTFCLIVDHLIQCLNKEPGGDHPAVFRGHRFCPLPERLLNRIRSVNYSREFGAGHRPFRNIEPNVHVFLQQLQHLAALRLRQQARAQRCRSYCIGFGQDGVATGFKARQGHRECKSDDQSEEPQHGAFKRGNTTAAMGAGAHSHTTSDLAGGENDRETDKKIAKSG